MTFNRNQVLCLSLIGALLINAGIHFTHPAYRFYQENITSLNNDLKLFKDRVGRELLPAIYTIATNRPSQIVSLPSDSSPSVLDSSSISKVVEKKEFVSATIFRSNGVFGFTYDDRIYHNGDFFFGSPIVYIDPTIIKTQDQTFYIEAKKKAILNEHS